MKSQLVLSALLLLAFEPTGAHQISAQVSNSPTPTPEASATPNDQQAAPDSPPTVETTIDARGEDESPRRSLVRWNQYEGPYFTFRLGVGLLVDYSGFAQDLDSKQQIEMHRRRSFVIFVSSWAASCFQE